jgi:hypothetical protein
MARSDISTTQQRAIAALMTCRTVDDAARQARVGLRTMFRWLASDDAFQRALRAAESTVIDNAQRRLVALQDASIDALSDLLVDPSPTARLGAARAIIESMLRLKELRDLETRLSELEKRL